MPETAKLWESLEADLDNFLETEDFSKTKEIIRKIKEYNKALNRLNKWLESL